MGSVVSKKKKKFKLEKTSDKGACEGAANVGGNDEDYNEARRACDDEEGDESEKTKDEESESEKEEKSSASDKESADEERDESEEKESEEEEDLEEKHESEEETEEVTGDEEKKDDFKDVEDQQSEKDELVNNLSYSETTQRALVGDLTIQYPSNAKVVRIFTSSTFTDTSVERNTLMERVYPKLKEYCQERGYDFQVVDMRWGVRDEATDDHKTSDLCMKEIYACQRLSTGPNFVTFLGQKYGYRPFPPQITADEFEKLLSAVDQQDDRNLLTHWFRRDDNSVPSKYLLQPITSLLPDYRNYEIEHLRKKASGEWWAAFERMQVVLRKAADKSLTETARQRYYMSVTEDEIRRGVITAPEVKKHCLWFKRTITNLEQNSDKPKAGSFIDKTWGNPPSVDQEAQILLNQFKEKEILKKLPKTNIKNYEVLWTDKGIDPVQSTKHAQYIEMLCVDFYEKLTSLISEGIAEKEAAETTDPAAEEIFQHSTFCQNKAKSFHGRCEFLDGIKETIKTVENRVVVLYGASGCGKTSLMAKIATKLKDWLQDEGSPIVVLRFIGTSPDSSSIRLLLRSVCLQLCMATQQPITSVPEDMKSLIDYFPECLEKAAEDQPVVLLFDSLDQLSIDEGGREMGWLPKNLPYNVYAILSTLPDEEFQCLGNLKIKFPDECFKKVPPIPLNEADQILDLWLKKAKRTLLPAQKKYIMDAFMKCQLPLYLKLAFDEAVRWKSYYQPNETRLAENVQDIINALFDRIERAHGKILVRRALAYITASKNGLTEPELEDLLSLDDTVLNDVYQYWTPPVRRLPPSLWIRIRSEINDYLIDRGADGTRVIFWYHRQFIEVARERYLQSEEAVEIHSKMSEYFLGIWSGKKKPYLDKSGAKNTMDRLVAKHPLMFDTSLKNPVFNLRKVSELPFHLLQSRQYDKMVQECLCNFEFLLAKLRSLSLDRVLDDFSSYLEVKPEDGDVRLLCETLRLATYPLKREPKQLPSQLLGRMFKFLEREKKHPLVYKVLKEAQSSSIPYFIPNMKCLTAPGGALVSTIPLSGRATDFISIAKDNKTVAITDNGGDGLNVKIVDCNNGRELRKFTLLEPSQMYRTNFNRISDLNKNHIFLAGSNTVYLLDTSTGKLERSFQITDDDWFGYSWQTPICFPDNEKMLAVIGPASLLIWRVEDEKKLHDIKIDGIDKDATEIGTIHSSGKLIAYKVAKQSTVYVVNADTGKQVQKIHVNLKGKKDQSSEAATVKEVKLVSNDQVLVLPSSCDQLRLYDIKSGALTRELNEFKMIQNMGNLQITNDGKKAVAVDMYEISITDLGTGGVEHCLRSPVMRMQNYTRDGVHFFSTGIDQVLRVYDRSREDDDENKGETTITEYEVKEQGRSFRISDQISLLTPCPDERHVVTMSTIAMKNVMSVWDTLTGNKVVEIGEVTVYPNPLRMSSLTRGVGFIYDQKGDYHYKVFNLKEGNIERRLSGKACKRMQAFGFINEKRMLSFSKGRRFLKMWDIDSGKVVKVVKCGQKYRFEEMLLSGNQKVAVCSQVSQSSSDSDYKEKTLPLIVFNTENLEHKELVLDDQRLLLYNARIDHNGRYLVTIIEWYQPLLWDIQEGALKHRLHFEDSYSTCAALSTEIMVAITADNQGGLRVWDIESGNHLRRMEDEATYIALHLSQSGKYIFAQDNKNTNFDAWDVETGLKVATFTIDGTSSMARAVGNTFTMGVTENPNLIILRLYQPGAKDESTPPSEYERISMPTKLIDVSDTAVMVDKVDDDKDDDTGQAM